MRRAFWLALAAAALSPLAASAYTLRFSPEPAAAGAAITATLDYYDPHGCASARLKRVAGPKDQPNVVRLEYAEGYCTGQLTGPGERSVSLAIGKFEPGEYTVEIVQPKIYGPPEPFLSRTLRVFAPPFCIPSAYRLCLQDGRFEVAVEWQDFAGNRGVATAVPQDPSNPIVPDTGFFWFFGPENLELMVKVLDGCGTNGHYWVFLSPASTVAVAVTVTDIETLATRRYSQVAGQIPKLTADTDAFPCL